MLITVYATYFIVSIAITVLAGRSLQAQAVGDGGQMLTAGFYLFSLSFIFLGLQMGHKPPVADMAANIEFLSGKLGITAIFIGVVHMAHSIARAILGKEPEKRA